MRAVAACAVALAVLAGGCTLLTSFDPEGQPCDTSAATVSGQCLSGYHCDKGKCVKGDPPDAG